MQGINQAFFLINSYEWVAMSVGTQKRSANNNEWDTGYDYFPILLCTSHSHIMYINHANYPSSSRNTAVYATLRYGLARDTCMGVDISISLSHGVGVCHPTHFPHASVHVRCRHIDTRPWRNIAASLLVETGYLLLQLIRSLASIWSSISQLQCNFQLNAISFFIST